MDSERDRILEKIKKCLALAKSGNQNEAETALRQARALMDKHRLSMDQVSASNCTEERVGAGVKREPPYWMISLAHVCAVAFGCTCMWGKSFRRSLELEWDVGFIGVDQAPSLSAYAYQVLLRQLQKARREFVATQKRVKLSTKRRRGDEFANAWISAVYTKVQEFAGADEEECKAIEAYKSEKYPNAKMTPVAARKTHARDYDAQLAGHYAGRAAQIQKPLGADQRQQLTAGASHD